jgi:hypothetical protein
MDDAKGLWSGWQELLSAFRGVFTIGGWARFAQWVTGTVVSLRQPCKTFAAGAVSAMG